MFKWWIKQEAPALTDTQKQWYTLLISQTTFLLQDAERIINQAHEIVNQIELEVTAIHRLK